MKINFMKNDSVYILKEYIKKNKILNYYSKDDNNWIKDITKNEENYGVLKKDFNDFKLVISDNPEKDDLVNIKILYSNLMGITDSQASDERLWAGLAHSTFWNYMQKRWPFPEKKEKQESFILQHYFFNNGARSTVLNGIARLWWYGRLFYDETNESNPFELIEYISKDLNGKAYMLLGSNFSSNRRLSRIFLYTIKNYMEDNNIVLDSKSDRFVFNELRKKMVLWSGKLVIDALDKETLENMLRAELKKILNSNYIGGENESN